MNFVHCYFLQQYFYDPSLYSIHYSLFPLLSIFVYSVFNAQIFSLCYFDLLFSHVFSIIILVFIRSFIQILYFVISHLYILVTNAIEYRVWFIISISSLSLSLELLFFVMQDLTETLYPRLITNLVYSSFFIKYIVIYTVFASTRLA